MERIAICITTRNRPEILRKAILNWFKFQPANSDVFIVDDSSTIKHDDISFSFQFESQVGIARAKNKCLELAKYYDHIFLADDDVWPKVKGWEKPYLESGLNHLALTFEKNSQGIFYSPSVRQEGSWNGFKTYTKPNGCFLYLTKEVLNTVGGMRPEFGLWGYEHVEYSQRIFNAGLTPHPFIDLHNSLDLIHVCDYFGEVKSCLTATKKMKGIGFKAKLLDKYKNSSDYVGFK